MIVLPPEVAVNSGNLPLEVLCGVDDIPLTFLNMTPVSPQGSLHLPFIDNRDVKIVVVHHVGIPCHEEAMAFEQLLKSSLSVQIYYTASKQIYSSLQTFCKRLTRRLNLIKILTIS